MHCACAVTGAAATLFQLLLLCVYARARCTMRASLAAGAESIRANKELYTRVACVWDLSNSSTLAVGASQIVAESISAAESLKGSRHTLSIFCASARTVRTCRHDPPFDRSKAPVTRDVLPVNTEDFAPYLAQR